MRTAPDLLQEPGYDLGAWRREIPILAEFVLMNNCSQSPLTRRTRAAVEAYLASWRRDGMDWDRWMDEVAQAKAAFARLIGAEVDEVAVTTSVSAATASLASALDFTGRRRKIVLTEAEFPTVGHVWLAHRKYGAAIAWVPTTEGTIDPKAYDAVLDDETLVLSACHGYYQSGFKQDLALLAEKAHGHGALLYVDAYQTLGTCRVDVKATGVDVLAAGTLKFLMGTPGIAFVYVRRAVQERLHPALTGWFGRTDPFAFDVHTLDWAPTAARFETGTPPIANAYVARAGIQMLEEIGVDAIEAWTDVLSQRLVDGGRARGLQLLGTADIRRKAPTTAFVCPGDAHAVEARLRQHGVIASARGPVIRLAPHFYNTLGDVDVALDALVRVFDEMA